MPARDSGQLLQASQTTDYNSAYYASTTQQRIYAVPLVGGRRTDDLVPIDNYGSADCQGPGQAENDYVMPGALSDAAGTGTSPYATLTADHARYLPVLGAVYEVAYATVGPRRARTGPADEYLVAEQFGGNDGDDAHDGRNDVSYVPGRGGVLAEPQQWRFAGVMM